MKLVKKQGTEQSPEQAAHKAATMDRRTFLKRSGIGAGGLAAASSLSLSMMQRSEAADAPTAGDGKASQIRTICTHCSVGCGIYAEVENGVWTGQEPAFDHPFNRGAATSRLTCSASLPRCGAPTMLITRRASAIPPLWLVLPTPGAMVP